MHIPAFDNQNQAIIDVDNNHVRLTYFNIVHLNKGQTFQYSLNHYESCVVPATGTISVDSDGQHFDKIGNRNNDVFDGEPEAVYIPTKCNAELVCISEKAELFIAGARYEKRLSAFAVRANDIDVVQYGSDETKTHRKIKHILGQKQNDSVGRLLLSELYTVGQGGWSGFPPHKHDTDREGIETHHDETYHFRFRPNHGSALQLLQNEDHLPGEAFQVFDGSTFCIPSGYHPCVAMPGYEMYYFTILGGASRRGLIQYFQQTHAYQIETIPGIKDMIAKFK